MSPTQLLRGHSDNFFMLNMSSSFPGLMRPATLGLTASLALSGCTEQQGHALLNQFHPSHDTADIFISEDTLPELSRHQECDALANFAENNVEEPTSLQVFDAQSALATASQKRMFCDTVTIYLESQGENGLELKPQTSWVCETSDTSNSVNQGTAPLITNGQSILPQFSTEENSDLSKIIQDAAATQAPKDAKAIAPENLSLPWNDPWPWLKALGGISLSVALYSLLGRFKNKFLSNENHEDWMKQISKHAFTAAQFTLIAGSAMAAMNFLGINVTAITTLMSLAISAIVITLKEFIHNGLAYILLRAAKKIKESEEIEIDGIRGVVKEITWQMIYLEGADDFGDPMWLSVPPNMMLNKPMKGYAKHPEMLTDLKPGMYVSLYNTKTEKSVAGKVRQVKDYAIVVRGYDSNGREINQIININDVNPYSFSMSEEAPALPFNLKRGSRVRVATSLGNLDGIIGSYDDRIFELVTTDSNTGKALISIHPRKKLEDGLLNLPETQSLPFELQKGQKIKINTTTGIVEGEIIAFNNVTFTLKVIDEKTGKSSLSVQPLKKLAEGYEVIIDENVAQQSLFANQ